MRGWESGRWGNEARLFVVGVKLVDIGVGIGGVGSLGVWELAARLLGRAKELVHASCEGVGDGDGAGDAILYGGKPKGLVDVIFEFAVGIELIEGRSGFDDARDGNDNEGHERLQFRLEGGDCRLEGIPERLPGTIVGVSVRLKRGG